MILKFIGKKFTFKFLSYESRIRKTIGSLNCQVIWIDAIHYKIRQEGRVISKACMIVLGVNVDGQQDILSMTIVETETASSWMAILEDLRNRGARDIFFLCSDNLPGLDKAIESIYPNSIRQICIVHQINLNGKN